MIVLPIISGLIGVGQSYLNNIIGQSVMQDLRTALYAHLQQMPLRFFTETKTGEIQSRLANDVGGVQSVVTDTAASLTSNIAIALSTVVAMFIIDWRLTLLSLGLLPFFMYLTYRVGKVNREVRGETQKSLAEMSAATEETLSVSGMLLSKTFGQQQTAIDRFSRLNRRLATLQVRQAMVGRWFFMIIGTIFSITPAFVYWLAGYLAIQNDPTAPTIGDIVAFTTLQSRLFFPLGQLLNVQVEIQGALALFDRIFEYLELDPVIVDAPDAIDLAAAPVAGRIRFRDVLVHLPDAAAAEARSPRRPPRRADGATAPVQRRAGPTPAPAADARARAAAVRPARHRLRGGARRPRRARRPVRLRQDDDDLPRAAALRRRRRARSRSTAWTSGKLTPRVARAGHRLRDPGDVPVPRHRPGEPPVREAGGRRRRSSRRPRGPRRSTIGSWSCRRATTRSSASAATSCRAARSSGSRSRGCCSRTRGS